MTSIRKIAKIAGVSPMTVHRALNNHPYVAPAVRKRILELAQMYAYHLPPVYTTSPLPGKTGVIACVLVDVGHFFHARILRGILEQALKESYHVITLQTFNEMDRLSLAVESLIEQRVDGILLWGMIQRVPKELLLTVQSAGIAVVGIGLVATGAPIDIVRTDEARIGELMVDHLWSSGHRRIAYVGTLHPGNSSLRGQSIIAALKRRGAELAGFHEIERDAIGDAVGNLFIKEPIPTAIIAFSDFYALQLMQQCAEHGIRVPQDVSVMGCANLIPWVDYLTPRLTSIDECPEEVGHRAAALLCRRIAEETAGVPAEPVVELITPTLVVRESCGLPPTRNAHRRRPGGKPL